MWNGFEKVGDSVYGFVIGAGAESGGNLKTDHEGKSGVCSDGPAPDMMCVFAASQLVDSGR
jgi:hypothetical protein